MHRKKVMGIFILTSQLTSVSRTSPMEEERDGALKPSMGYFVGPMYRNSRKFYRNPLKTFFVIISAKMIQMG